MCEARGEPPPDVFWTRESKNKIIVTDKNSGKRKQGETLIRNILVLKLHLSRFLACVVKYSINQDVLCSFVFICLGEESLKSPVHVVMFPDSMLDPFLHLIFNDKSYLARSTISYHNNKVHFLQDFQKKAYNWLKTILLLLSLVLCNLTIFLRTIIL